MECIKNLVYKERDSCDTLFPGMGYCIPKGFVFVSITAIIGICNLRASRIKVLFWPGSRTNNASGIKNLSKRFLRNDNINSRNVFEEDFHVPFFSMAALFFAK